MGAAVTVGKDFWIGKPAENFFLQHLFPSPPHACITEFSGGSFTHPLASMYPESGMRWWKLHLRSPPPSLSKPTTSLKAP